MYKYGKQKGFTLVEVMIVILIISILTGMAIPSFLNSRSRAKSRACTENLRQINQAKEQLAMTNSLAEGTLVTTNQLMPYLHNQQFPTCPSGGIYDLKGVGTSPTCSIGVSVTPPHTLVQN